MKKLAGKKALVTGAASGIGKEIVKLFAREGADVVINYRSRKQDAEDLRAGLEGECGVKCPTYQADISVLTEVRAMVDFTVAELGKIDILVCSSGINFQVPVKDMTVEQWDRMIQVNLTGVFYCNRFVLPHMLENGFGRIINITSQLGQIGAVDDAHYAAAKAGIIGFTKSLAREVSKLGVTANCIAPGPVANEFFFKGCLPEWRAEKLKSLPLGRFGTDEEVAPSALLLAASPDGDSYTGQTLGPNCGDVML